MRNIFCTTDIFLLVIISSFIHSLRPEFLQQKIAYFYYWRRSRLPFRSIRLHLPHPCFSGSHKRCSVRMYLIVFSSEFMFYLCHLYLTTHNGVQQDFYIKWCAFRLKVTRDVPHMEQDLHTNTEYLSSSLIILWRSCCSIFNILCSALYILYFCPFSFGHCTVYPSLMHTI